MREPYRSLYIHIPFCRSRCFYCDFASSAVAQDDERIGAYVENLVMEIFKLGRNGELSEIESIYIGGGTPSFIGSKHLTSIMYAIGLSVNLVPDMEITLEANPDSFDERLARDIYALGVNRISFGVQSFDDDLLKAIGRPHTAEDARKAIEAAKERFDNISIDLMCGLPGQTIDSFRCSLEEAVSLGIKHVSVYPLTIEEGTKMFEMVRDGQSDLPSDDATADMMELCAGFLRDKGFEHYEVSNFALPGFRSKHNLSYWKGKPYLGLGFGAVGMIQDDAGRIRMKDGEIDDELDPHQADCEDLMLAMRTIDGIEVERLRALEENGFSGIVKAFEDLEEMGLVEKTASRIVPTPKGMLLGNEIYERILDFF